MIKDILTAGRAHNKYEREMLYAWLSERDLNLAALDEVSMCVASPIYMCGMTLDISDWTVSCV